MVLNMWILTSGDTMLQWNWMDSEASRGVSLFMAAENVMMALAVFRLFLWEAYEIACFCEQKNLTHN